MLYWTDGQMQRIEAYNIITTQRHSMFTVNMAFPDGIAVDPLAG